MPLLMRQFTTRHTTIFLQWITSRLLLFLHQALPTGSLFNHQGHVSAPSQINSIANLCVFKGFSNTHLSQTPGTLRIARTLISRPRDQVIVVPPCPSWFRCQLVKGHSGAPLPLLEWLVLGELFSLNLLQFMPRISYTSLSWCMYALKKSDLLQNLKHN